MSRDVISVKTTDTLMEVVKLMRDNHISGVPVLDEGNKLRGVISESDILKLVEYKPFLVPFLELLEKHPGDMQDIVRTASKRKVVDVMSQPPIAVNPDTLISESALLMWNKKLNRLPVVDRNGNLLGIVTRADLLKIFGT